MSDTRYKKMIDERVRWLRETIQNAGFRNGIIAVSGGIDSAVVLSLTTLALGKENVYAVLLPCGKLSTQATRDGKRVVSCAGLTKDHIIQRNIQKAVDGILKLEKEASSDMIRKGNIMARIRMTFLYDLAKERNALVVGTENRSEYYLGYYTRFGDEASDIEPIRNLYKTQVRKIAEYLRIPQEIITKAPSAGLWKGQTDENQFGFSYESADQILHARFEKNLSVEQTVAQGFDRDLVEKVLQRVQANNFKHHLPHIFL